jgi:hypothetical protein
MFSPTRSQVRPCDRCQSRYVRPTLEALEDRLTPSTVAPMPAVASSGPAMVAPAVPGPTAGPIAISPTQLFFLAGQTDLNIAVTLTNSSTGARLSGGTATLTVINQQGTTVGSPVTANVGGEGQVSATYTVPANLRVGPYTLEVTYHNSGSPVDGSTAKALLYLTIGPVQGPSPSSSPAPEPIQAPSQLPSLLTMLQSDFALFFEGAELAVDHFLHEPTDVLQARIDATMASAGPWGPLFEMFGESLVNQAVQGHSV